MNVSIGAACLKEKRKDNTEMNFSPIFLLK